MRRLLRVLNSSAQLHNNVKHVGAGESFLLCMAVNTAEGGVVLKEE